MEKPCATCSDFRNGYELFNTNEKSYIESISLLKTIKSEFENSTYILYQCPDCKTYFIRTKSQEWDSYEEKIIDSFKINEIDFERVQSLLFPESINPNLVTINTSLHCSKCNSDQIEKKREINSGDQILVWYKCNSCGNEEFMDAYEID